MKDNGRSDREELSVPIEDRGKPEKQEDAKSNKSGRHCSVTPTGSGEEHNKGVTNEGVKRCRTDGERPEEGGSQRVAKHSHHRQQTTRRGGRQG